MQPPSLAGLSTAGELILPEWVAIGMGLPDPTTLQAMLSSAMPRCDTHVQPTSPELYKQVHVRCHEVSTPAATLLC